MGPPLCFARVAKDDCLLTQAEGRPFDEHGLRAAALGPVLGSASPMTALQTRQGHDLFDERVVGPQLYWIRCRGRPVPGAPTVRRCVHVICPVTRRNLDRISEPRRRVWSPDHCEITQSRHARSGQRRPLWCSREVAGRSWSPLLTRRIAAAIPPRFRSGYRGTRRSPRPEPEQSSIEPSAAVRVARRSPEFAVRWPILG